MDIDISNFSKKAQDRIYRDVLLNWSSVFRAFLILGSYAVIFGILVIIPLFYFSGQSVQTSDFINSLLPYTSVFIVALFICGIYWNTRNSFKSFTNKLTGNVFKKCYECNTPNNYQTVCVNCGADITIKKLPDCKKTLKKFLFHYYRIICISTILAVAITTVLQSYNNAKNFKGSYGAFDDGSCKMVVYPEFQFGEAVTYKGEQGKVVAVTIADKFHKSYTILTDIGKISGLQASELKKGTKNN